jgi:hypothetical protein
MNLKYFVTNLSKYLNFKYKRINHIFGNRYCATLIENEKHFANVIRYIYQNPVRAGIVAHVNEHPYSSHCFYSGDFNPGVRITADTYTQRLFNNGLSGWEEWHTIISTIFEIEDVKQLRQSFTRFKYKLSKRQLLNLNLLKTSLSI